MCLRKRLIQQHTALFFGDTGCAAGTYFDVFDGKGCILSLIACDEEMQKYIAPVNGYGYVI